jgi:hypothetical protein
MEGMEGMERMEGMEGEGMEGDGGDGDVEGMREEVSQKISGKVTRTLRQ